MRSTDWIVLFRRLATTFDRFAEDLTEAVAQRRVQTDERRDARSNPLTREANLEPPRPQQERRPGGGSSS